MNSHRNTSGANGENNHENGSGTITRTHEHTRTMSTIESSVDPSVNTIAQEQVSVYEEQVEELYELIEKKAELEASSTGVRKNEEYLRIQRRIAEIKDNVDELVSGFGQDEFSAVYQRLDNRPAPA